MRFLSPLLALALLALSAAAGSGQERVELRGRVVDEASGAPLSGAWVTSPLADLRVLTDTLGAFSISLIEDQGYDLIAESMGYHGLRFRLEAGAESAVSVVQLMPVPGMLEGLAALETRLEQRRRRRGGMIRVLRHDSLWVSPERDTYRLVERAIPMARSCSGRPENLCLPGTRERAVRLCIDDLRPAGGASELGAYDPTDLWLVEIYGRGARVRIYTRWFVENLARRGGTVALNPPC